MFRHIFVFLFLMVVSLVSYGNLNKDNLTHQSVEQNNLPRLDLKVIYSSLGSNMLRYSVFEEAYKGFVFLKEKKQIKKNVLTIIDYELPSTKKRLWVIDLDRVEILFNELVAHGKNSGGNFATSFSNIPQSYMSSLGFFTTAGTYYGKHGLSLLLDGIEKGVNDNARKRYIVMHAAKYVSDEFIKKYGRLGRSHGCPALSYDCNKSIINTIKDKSCIFINGYSKEYLALHNVVF